MNKYLRFEEYLTEDHKTIYEIYNKNNLFLGTIEKVRVGAWQHWCHVVRIHDKRFKDVEYVYNSPGCQDEIRQFCRSLAVRK